MKHLKVPTDLIAAPYNNKALQMNGLSVVDSCFYNEKTVGSMFLEEHIIFYVLKGQATLSHGRKKHIVKKDEFVLLKRATMYGFVKEGNIIGTESAFHGLLFCLKDEILLDFIRMANIHREATDSYKLAVRQANGRLKAFTESLMPYFDDSMNIDDIETRPLWKPMHQQPVFANNPFYGNGFSDYLFESGLCLPSGSSMSDDDVNRVIDIIENLNKK